MPTKSKNVGGHGGARTGAGRKKTALKDRIENGGDLGMLPPPPDAPEGIDVPDFPKTRRQKCL